MELYQVLRRPILTEKSGYQSETLNRFTFAVDARANKLQVRDAVELAFKVKVVDVHIMNVHGKMRRFGRRFGRTADWKKAVVTLAAGNTISYFEGV
jgi:large subunit ribosomal protein L23